MYIHVHSNESADRPAIERTPLMVTVMTSSGPKDDVILAINVIYMYVTFWYQRHFKHLLKHRRDYSESTVS